MYVCVCLCVFVTQGEVLNVPFTVAAEKKSCLAGMVKVREIEKHTNDYVFFPATERKRD